MKVSTKKAIAKKFSTKKGPVAATKHGHHSGSYGYDSHGGSYGYDNHGGSCGSCGW